MLASPNATILVGNTSMDPDETAFFWALHTSTKITSRATEIVNDVQVIHAGQRAGSSKVMLLNMLNIPPFMFDTMAFQIVDLGSTFCTGICCRDEKVLVDCFVSNVNPRAPILLASQYWTIVSIPQPFVDAYKNLLAIPIAISYTSGGVEKANEYLAGPKAIAITAAPATEATPAVNDTKAKEGCYKAVTNLIRAKDPFAHATNEVA